jgi:photosystem II stability/assembly factor-like uncharacterized protein
MSTPYNNFIVNDLADTPVAQPYVNSNVEVGYFYSPSAIGGWYSMNTVVSTTNGIATLGTSMSGIAGLKILNAGIYKIHLSFFPLSAASDGSDIKFNFGTTRQVNNPTTNKVNAFGGSNNYGMYTFDNNYNNRYPGIISWLANGYQIGSTNAGFAKSAGELNFTYGVFGYPNNGDLYSGCCSTQITFILNGETTIYFNVSATSSGTTMSNCYFTLELISSIPAQLKNWTNQNNSSPLVWSSIASDSTGQYLAAVTFPGSIYMSSDYGSTWTQTTTAFTGRYWTGIASNSTGTLLVAVSGETNGTIWRSSTSGTSWGQLSGGLPDPANWLSIASSDDGTQLAAVIYGGGIWTSPDSGSTWSLQSAPTPTTASWWSIASSSDGTKIVAVINGGDNLNGEGIWRSINSGSTWGQLSGGLPVTANWRSIASSDDGTHLAAVVNNGGGIWTSSDSGTTWTQTNAPSEYWTSIASSSTGQYLAAVVSTGYIYTSTDYGTTWSNANNAPSQAWSSIAMSSNGGYSAAVNGFTKIYTSIASY